MLINIFVLIIYFLVITFFVQQKSNNQIQPKWWQVSISIVAAETSALTFVSLPGIAFAGNLNFLQLALGYILGRVFIAFILLPKYKKNQITTAYTFVGQFYGWKPNTKIFINYFFVYKVTS
jgi:Na+/proline symporter